MQVALYARVSTPTQQQEGTIVSQVHSLHRVSVSFVGNFAVQL